MAMGKMKEEGDGHLDVIVEYGPFIESKVFLRLIKVLRVFIN